MSHLHRGSLVVWNIVLLASLCFFAFPPEARSQAPNSGNAELVGSVVDRRSEDPVPSARINLLRSVDGASAWSGVSDEDGHFRTSPLPLGEYRLQVEAPPFVGLEEAVSLSEAGVVDMRVEMVGVDYELEPIVAVARRSTRLERDGFYDRQRQGLGQFLTRADIEAERPMVTTDAFRRMPGVRVAVGTSPRQDSIVLARQGGCAPLVVIDGAQVNLAFSGVNDRLNPEDLEAIEVYRGGEVPARWTGLTQCGVVMFWTRDPSTAGGGGWLPSWKKLLIVGGLVGLAILATK